MGHGSATVDPPRAIAMQLDREVVKRQAPRSDARHVYERAALILDDERHPLGDLSLQLITLGLRPLYATDFDELVLLAREYREQVGAVLVSAHRANEALPSLRKRVLEPLGLPPAAVIPVGDRLAPQQSEALRGEGLRLCLRSPYEAHELRFVVARTLSDTDPEELRLDPRVPCNLPVMIQSEHRETKGRLADLSTGGAFVALAHPHGERSQVALAFTLREQACTVTARVAWRTGPASPPWCDRGMGVEFVGTGSDTRTLLRRFVAEQVHRFRL